MKSTVSIFDSTLRDGAQGHGIAFSVEDKLGAARLLDALGVAYIEAGNPGSNPKDEEFFKRAGAMKSMYHIIEVEDPTALFPIDIVTL